MDSRQHSNRDFSIENFYIKNLNTKDLADKGRHSTDDTGSVGKRSTPVQHASAGSKAQEPGVMTGQRLLQWMKALDQPRPAGSSVERKAASYIAKTIRAAGGEPETESFPIWLCKQAAALTVSGSNSETSVLHIPVLAYDRPVRQSGHPDMSLDTYACADQAAPQRQADASVGQAAEWAKTDDPVWNEEPERLEAAGPLLYVEDGGPHALSMAEGCIVMLNETVSSDLYRKLSEAGAVAYLTITGTPIDAGQDRLPARRRISRGEERTIPGATIHCQDASMLIEKMAADETQKLLPFPGSGRNTRARLTVDSSIVRKTSQNVCVSVSGKTDRRDYVLLTAHYDSVPEGPGAYDNLAACSVLVELYRRLRLHPADREVRFAWLGAEEQGMLGSYAYVRCHESELDACLADINIDLSGQAIGSDVIGVTGSDSFASEIRDFLEEYGSDAEVRQSIWSGDANTFAWKGVPALTYDRDGFGMHTCHDEQRFLSAWELGRETDLIEAMVRRLADREAFASERKLPGEMEQELQKLFAEY